MYYIVYGFLYTVSLLPDFVLYGIGNLIAFFMNHVFGYRKTVVMSNLAIAFPEKSLSERKKIASKFYHNLVDSFIEVIMLFSISDKRLDRMFEGNVDLVNSMTDKGQKVQLTALHQFNWEVLNLIAAKKFTGRFVGVYMPISNPIFEKIFKNLRTRYGTELVSAHHFKRDFLKYENTPSYILGLVADQSPGSPLNAHWVNFFERPTAFVTGPEKGARIAQSAVVFAAMIKIRRGVYTIEFEKVTDNAALLAKGELTLRYARFTEKTIRRTPDNYLWSHRRWKHVYKEEYAENALEPLPETIN